MDGIAGKFIRLVVGVVCVGLVCLWAPGDAAAQDSVESLDVEELEADRKRYVGYEVASGITMTLGAALTGVSTALVVSGLTTQCPEDAPRQPEGCGAGAGIAVGLGAVGLGIGVPVTTAGTIGMVVANRKKRAVKQKLAGAPGAGVGKLRVGVSPVGRGVKFSLGFQF